MLSSSSLRVLRSLSSSRSVSVSVLLRPLPLFSSSSSSSAVSFSSSSVKQAEECDPRWLSDAEDRIKEVPVIEVEGNLAVCDGGSGALGHPIEYMTLNTIKPGPVTCKYCGLRFIKKERKNRYGKSMKFEAD